MKPRSRTKKTLSAAQVTAILDELARLYPQAECELDFQGPLQLLVAVILSAQCTDRRVNQVTPALFARFPDAGALSSADPEELQEMIRSTGFFRNKARHIQEACRKIVQDFGGEVPRTMEELLTLPGVARKTANVVLGVAYGAAVGVVVDTHIGRLAGRLGMTRHTDPVKIERDLMALWPRERWISAGHELIWHGRRVCEARKPRCESCSLCPLCPFGQKAVLAGEPAPIRKAPRRPAPQPGDAGGAP